jgi:hypothetical protein
MRAKINLLLNNWPIITQIYVNDNKRIKILKIQAEKAQIELFVSFLIVMHFMEFSTRF